MAQLINQEIRRTRGLRNAPQNMSLGIDFVKCLPSELAVGIFSRLDNPVDLMRACVVSRTWEKMVVNEALAKNLCFRKCPPTLSISEVVDIENCTSTFRSVSNEKLKRDHKMYSSLLYGLHMSTHFPRDCLEYVIGASSTNRYPYESVVNVLLEEYGYAWGMSYWSSKGNVDSNATESILFKLTCSACIINQIAIRPYEAASENGRPIYSARAVRFRMGHPKVNADLKIDVGNLPLMELPNDKYVWTYTSPQFEMFQQSQMQQTFFLPKPALCLGGYLLIELLGSVQKRELDGLYYTCLTNVSIFGHPLSPGFGTNVAANQLLHLLHWPNGLEPTIQMIAEYDGDLDDHVDYRPSQAYQIQDLVRKVIAQPILWDQEA